MQPDLVPTPADAADERAHPGVLEEIGAVARAVVAMGEEVEGAAQPVALADVHEEVEGVVRIEAAVAEQRARTPRGQPRVSPPHEIAAELARDVAWAVVERRQRIVDVVGQDDLERARAAPQARPGPLQGLPQQLDVGVDDRRAEEAGAAGDRRRGREAPVAVAIGDHELLVAREHEERAAEDVDLEPLGPASAATAP